MNSGWGAALRPVARAVPGPLRQRDTPRLNLAHDLVEPQGVPPLLDGDLRHRVSPSTNAASSFLVTQAGQ
jgi:hypothetical protein